MKIEKLKPGDVVRLHSIETLLKRGLIEKGIDVPYVEITELNRNDIRKIQPDMLSTWKNDLTVTETFTGDIEFTPCVYCESENNEWWYSPEWIRCRVKQK